MFNKLRLRLWLDQRRQRLAETAWHIWWDKRCKSLGTLEPKIAKAYKNAGVIHFLARPGNSLGGRKIFFEGSERGGMGGNIVYIDQLFSHLSVPADRVLDIFSEGHGHYKDKRDYDSVFFSLQKMAFQKLANFLKKKIRVYREDGMYTENTYFLFEVAPSAT